MSASCDNRYLGQDDTPIVDECLYPPVDRTHDVQSTAAEQETDKGHERPPDLAHVFIPEMPESRDEEGEVYT